MSITVVPKTKAGPTTAVGGARSKENEAIEQPMGIEVDPVALQKTRATAQTAKSRKSYPPTSRPVPTAAQQSSQKQYQQNTATPPILSIPSRHLSVDINRPSTLPLLTSSRVPSITVRPVTQMPATQPSIVLQSGSSNAASITAMKQSNGLCTSSVSSTTTSRIR